MKQFLVNKKEYKTEVGFNRLQTANKESFVLGSQNGDLRFY